jgi:hypothetical protein
VTLFASIFAFVTAFPLPPAQNNDQFQASLVYSPNGLNVTSIHILHLAGPLVSGTGVIYLKSSTQPSQPEFQTTYTVSQGLGGANSWNLGQVWNWTFSAPYIPSSQGNITIYVVASSQLLFSVILPGTGIAAPPTVIAAWTSPATPMVGQPFTVFATLAGSYKANSVYVNLDAVSGPLVTYQMQTQPWSAGRWFYNASAGMTSTPGAFYAFVNASSSSGQQAIAAFTITITFNVMPWTITLSPTSMAHGTSSAVSIVGAGFVGGSSVSITLNSTLLVSSASYSCSTGLSGSTVTVTAAGAFTCSYTLAKAAAAATYWFTAYDSSSGQTATAYFSRT